jgi:hypothetical protein
MIDALRIQPANGFLGLASQRAKSREASLLRDASYKPMVKPSESVPIKNLRPNGTLHRSKGAAHISEGQDPETGRSPGLSCEKHHAF